MKQRTTRELFAHWNALRGERAAPERAEVDPVAVGDALSDTFVLEYADDGAHRVRLAGSRIASLILREPRGEPFADLWRKTDRAAVVALVDGVCDGQTPAVAGVIAAPRGLAPARYELLLLPLRHRGRTHARLLGSLATDEAPTWLGLIPTDPLELGPVRSLFREDGAERPRASPARPAMRVIEGGMAGVLRSR
ncbi:MAG: PAS domain-containing protein [Hyphomicrobiales bacterium]|nr:PAS domain-containing protein [Hyphomicrobiales bacterium]MDE2017766.1 PAS domain-containing protein [Hyphomicrobiales bacterium]